MFTALRRSSSSFLSKQEPHRTFFSDHKGRRVPTLEIADWIKKITSAPAETRTDTIDALRTRQLQRTLPTRIIPEDARGELVNQRNELGKKKKLEQEAVVGLGEPLPKGHHLAYFQPDSVISELGQDGSSTEYNAPAPYLRRMWAGGWFSFTRNPELELRIGEDVVEQSSVRDAEFKSGMIFVQQQRDLYRVKDKNAPPELNGQDWAVREIRTHVFRQNEDVSKNDSVKDRAKRESTASPYITSRRSDLIYTPTAPLLFRFSALTYNAHRIHYDRHWTQAVENHPDLVVHGPLTALLLVEIANNIGKGLANDKNPGAGHRLKYFGYRATSPMYVDKPINLFSDATAITDGQTELGAEQDGRVGMKATVEYFTD